MNHSLAFAFIVGLLLAASAAYSQSNVATATCRNAAGDGFIVQAAISTGETVHIVGPCDLDTSVSFTKRGQLLYGDGRTITIMNVSTVLPTGAFVFNTGEEGPIIQDIGFVFPQPDVSARSGLITYTPAIYAENTPRFKLERVRITGAMVGVDAKGNSGGLVINDFEESAFSVGIWLDGSLDSVSIHNWHFWPFGLTANQRTIWNAANGACSPQTTSGTAGPIGLYSGRADDLTISDSAQVVGQAMCFVQTSAGTTFALISNNDFDTYSGIAQSAGQIQISNSFFSLGDNMHQSINLSGGQLQCSSCRFEQGNGYSAMAVAFVSQGSLMLNNAYVDIGASDAEIVWVGGSNIFLTINGLQLNSTATTQVNPKIAVSSGAIANITGVFPLEKIISGNLLNIGFDNYHRIVGNGLNVGWRNACALSSKAVYANNGTTAASTCN